MWQWGEWGEGTQGSFKHQLICLGSLFVISGNPLEPGAESRPDNQGKQEDGGGGGEHMSVHLHRPHTSLGETPRRDLKLLAVYINNCLVANVCFGNINPKSLLNLAHSFKKPRMSHTLLPTVVCWHSFPTQRPPPFLQEEALNDAAPLNKSLVAETHHEKAR